MDIRQASLANLKSPVQSAGNSATMFLCFQLSGKYYAIPQSSVREMMPVQPPDQWIMPIEGLLGVIHSRNHRIPVIDIYARLGIAQRPRRRPSRLIVAITSDSIQFAFFADTISDIADIPSADIHAGVIQGHGRPKTILKVDDLVTPSQTSVFA